MGHRLIVLLGVVTLGVSPVSATTMTMDNASAVTTTSASAQSGAVARSSVSSSQAKADKAARKAAKAAVKQARKCAKWARKAASAHSARKRAKFSARYNARCVTTAKTTTTTLSTPTSSTVGDALSGSDSITSVTGPFGVPGIGGKSTYDNGSYGSIGNGTPTPPAASLAVSFSPEFVTGQVPEPGTLALLGLGLAGLGLSRRRNMR